LTKLYQNGLPFNGPLDMNLDKLIDRVDKKKASLIVIDGGIGEGKTTKMIHLLDYINKKKGFPEIEIDKKGPQLGMGGVSFMKKLRTCFEDKLPCIGYDEAGDFSRRGSLTGFNAMINRTFETFRAFKCIVIMALPNFDVLDQQLLDNKIPRLLLHLKDRTENTGNYYGYSLYRMQLLKYRMSKLKIKNYAYSTVWPNFYGHYLDLTPERSKMLDKVSTSSKIDILRKSEIKAEGLMTYPELATKLMKSIIWVRNAVATHKIKVKREIGRQKYFDQQALNILSEYVDKMQDRRRGVK